MNDKPLVSCLTATHGRFSVLREALACFMEQDYHNRELIILNTHPQRLICELPRVYMYNEPEHVTLGACRNRLLELANGELVRTWDDDDLYLPWAISQGVAHINGYAGCKPAVSWDCSANKHYRLGDNVYEAAMTIRTDIAQMYGYKESGGDEHYPLLINIEKHGFNKFAVRPQEASYCYRWASSLYRISGTLGSGEAESNRAAQWKQANQDTGNGDFLTPADVSQYYTAIAKAAET